MADDDRRGLLAAGWFFALALLVVLLVAWGATVRLTGSGLSIPDWPLINGSLLPPSDAAGWRTVLDTYQAEARRVGNPRFPAEISLEHFKSLFAVEYTHRALAALVGLVFVAALIMTVRVKSLRKRVEPHLSLLAALLLGQAMLGGVVVKGALASTLVALHLAVAFIFFGVIIWTAFKLLPARPYPPGASRSAGLPFLALGWSALGLLFVQVVVGGLLAGVEGGKVLNSFPLMAGKLIPPADLIASYRITDSAVGNLLTNKVLLQFFHRWLPLAALAVYALLRIRSRRLPLVSRAQWSIRIVDGILIFQIILGVGNLMAGAPTVMSALHTVTALLLFGAVVMLTYDLRYGVNEKTA